MRCCHTIAKHNRTKQHETLSLMAEDEQYMQRCIDLARSGLGMTAPNPMVGAVLVYKGRIIGEGCHQRYGDHHAEVRAIASVKDEQQLKHATLYVNLEPCCHHGKTPPCTDLILKKGIPRVVIGTADPFDEVAGKGIARLRSNGCSVLLGVLKERCRQLNKRFFTFYEKKRPYVILKWAQTADGYIDTDREQGAENRPTWITNEQWRILVHKWRTEEAAIMVGTATALKDNPMLNVRDWDGPSPVRIVLDRHLKLPSSLNIFDNSQPTIVVNEQTTKTNGNTRFIQLSFDESLLGNILSILFEEDKQSLIVEGGRKLLQSFIAQNLWDEARVFTGSRFFGNGVPAPLIREKRSISQAIIGNESLFYFLKQGVQGS